MTSPAAFNSGPVLCRKYDVRSQRSPSPACDDQFRIKLDLGTKALRGGTQPDELKRRVADFNRDWPDVTRTRETFVLAEEFAT